MPTLTLVTAKALSLHDERWAGPVDRRPVTELALTVVAPAVRCAVGRDTACMIAAGTEPGEGQATHDWHGARPINGSSVAELTIGVVAPTIRRPGRR